jgi:hypothetical protein
MSKWIKIEDEKPKDGQIILTASKYGIIECEWVDIDGEISGCFEFCSSCGRNTLDSWVGMDGLCRDCRREESMEDEFDYDNEEWSGE